MDDVLVLRLENKRAIHRQRIFYDRMSSLFTHIDKCLLKCIWFNTNRRYKWHCCLLLFGVTNNRVCLQRCIPYIYLFNAAVYHLHDQKIRIILINFRFSIGNDRQSKRLHVLANLGRILFFIFFWIKTGIRDFLLDIYFA